MRGQLQLRDGSRFDSNSVALAEITKLNEGIENLTLRGDSQMIFSVPADDLWLPDASKGDVFVRTLEGSIREWRLATMTEISKDASVVVECDPMITLLRDLDVVHSLAGTGGTTYWNEGGTGLDADLFLQGFVQSILLNDHGIDWIVTGTFDSVRRFDLNFDASTLLEACLAVASRVQGELTMEPDEGNGWYELSIYDALNASATEVHISDSAQLSRMQRTRSPTEMVTIGIPRGGLPEGASNRFTSGQASWKVDGAPSGGWVALVDPNGGAGPILEDGQFVEQGTTGDYRDFMPARHLLKRNGDLEEVIDSDFATQAVKLADTTNIADGDYIELRKNSDGDLATELESVTGLAASGRVVGKIDRDEMRGERNWVPNPFTTDGFPDNRIEYCQIDGAHAAVTTVNLKGLPASYVVNDDSVLVRTDAFNATFSYRITTGGTADGAGDLAVTVDRNFTASDNDDYLVYDHSSFPTEYAELSTTTNPPIFMRLRTAPASVSGLVDGTQSNVFEVVVDGFGANEPIYAGDVFLVGNVGELVREDVTLNGSGAGTVKLRDKVSVTNNDAVTIERKDFATSPKGTYALLLHTIPTNARIQAGAYTIPPLVGITRLVGIMKYKIVVGNGNRSSNLGWTAGNEPMLDVWDVTGAASLGSATAATINTTSDDMDAVYTLIVDLTYTTETEVELRVRGPSAGGCSIAIFHLGLYQIEGSGEPVPVNGSHANEMHQEANNVLSERGSWTTSYRGTAATASDAWALDPADPALVIGGTTHLVGTGAIAVNERVRLVDQRINMKLEEEELVFNQTPEGLSRKVTKAQPAALFVDVDFEVQVDTSTGEGEVEETLLPKTEPPDNPGVPRIIVPPGDTLPSVPPARVVLV